MEKIIEHTQVCFYIVTMILLLVQFVIYSILVRPYVGSIIDPHSLNSGFFIIDDNTMFWIAIVSLLTAIAIYSAMLLAERSYSSKNVPFMKVALINIVMAFGQLMLVLH